MLPIDFPSCPILIEESIIGKRMDASAIRKRVAADRLDLGFAPLVNTGSREDTTMTAGTARNLVISFRRVRDLNSFDAIAKATGSSQSRDFP